MTPGATALAVGIRRLVESPLPDPLVNTLQNPAVRHVLLDVPHVRVHHVNLWLLAWLLRAGRCGLLVVIDRPACQVLHQLQSMGVDPAGLLAIDLVTGISCPQGQPSSNILLVHSPFAADLRVRLGEIRGQVERGGVPMARPLQFLMVDNLPILDFYVEADEIVGVLGSLENLMPPGTARKTVVPMDPTTRPKVTQALAGWADVTLAMRWD